MKDKLRQSPLFLQDMICQFITVIHQERDTLFLIGVDLGSLLQIILEVLFMLSILQVLVIKRQLLYGQQTDML